MIHQHFTLLKQCFLIPEILQTGFWSVTYSESPIMLRKQEHNISQINVTTKLHLFLTVFLLLDGAYTFTTYQIIPSLKIIFLFGFAAASHCVNHMCILYTQTHSSSICDLVLGLFYYPARFPGVISKKRARSNIYTRLGISFGYAAYVTILLLPVAFLYLIQWFDPCNPSIVGYRLIVECMENYDNTSIIQVVINSLSKLGVFLINHWLWSTGVRPAHLMFCGVGILCTVALTQYVLE